MATTPIASMEAPPHVPANLMRDFDYLDMGEESDFHAFWRQLRDGPPIFYTPRQGGHWVFTRYDDIAHALATHENFSSIYEVIPFGSTAPNVPPFGMDPPQHGEFRRLLAPYFSPKAIQNLEVRSRELTESLLDKARGRTECEFASEFALTMPIGIFMSLIDVPDTDRLTLVDAAERAVRSPTAEGRVRAYQDLEAYLVARFEERSRNPGTDMLSALLTERVEGGRLLTERERLDCGSALLAAGLDTVAGMLGYMVMFLARNDLHRRRLVEHPEDIPQAIEEMMRCFSITNLGRMVRRDMVYKGVTFKKGDAVLCSASLAGLDDQHYENPETVDFDRPDKRNLAFGKGPHQCIGAFLACTEMRVFLSEWLKRVPDFRIKPGDKPRVATGPSSTVLYLPLEWDTPLP